MKPAICFFLLALIFNSIALHLACAADEQMNGTWTTDSLTCQGGSVVSNYYKSLAKSMSVTINGTEYKSYFKGQTCSVSIQGRIEVGNRILTIRERSKTYIGDCNDKEGNHIASGTKNSWKII